jgi:endogenous inhibitor of DNA gyrase (YacG/DUF329 family)
MADILCIVCGKIINKRNKIYCSKRCFVIDYNHKRKFPAITSGKCRRCGGDIISRTKREQTRVFCSLRCAGLSLGESGKGKTKTSGMLGKHHTEKTKRKISENHRGYHHTEETKRKISDNHKRKGVRPPPNPGRKHSTESKRKISIARLGKATGMTGAKSHLWKGGITSVSMMIRESMSYKIWRRQVFERDDYTCVLCGIKGCKLNVDHYPKSFSEIRNENNITTLEEAMQCKELWDISIGRTLCEDCHKKTDNYLKPNISKK